MFNGGTPVTNIIPQSVIVRRPIQQIVSAPLGSSQNPIRIIQQGNQYTPVQQLTPEQLQQIMHVVQQQQATKNPGSSIIFNPQTNTKIVYRVIYPSQLHKDAEKLDGKESNLTPKRVYKKRMKDEEEKIDGPELSKEEKEMRKKMRPKTRSGRVSKPPKHMVSDYKHIHVLDYDEDYDDSDGGYSDFKLSDNDEDGEENIRKTEDENYVSYGLDSNKPKNWKCITCGKAYIGKAGLGRHLRINPSHGSLDPDAAEMEPPDPNVTPPDDSLPNTPATPNGAASAANSTGSFSEDSRDSSISHGYNPTPQPRGRGRGRGRRGWRGRGLYRGLDPESRRQARLKEVMNDCTDEELMEIVLPRLAKVITLWEFLLMKVERGGPAPGACVDDIYREYEGLHTHVRRMCQQYLEHVGPSVAEPAQAGSESQPLLQVENPVVAQALGLSLGAHRVSPIQESEVQHKYKFLTTKASFTNKSTKRTVEVVTPEEMISPTKKPKLTSPAGRVAYSPQTSKQSIGNVSETKANNCDVLTTQVKQLTPTVLVDQSGHAVKSNIRVAGSTKTVSLLTSNSLSSHTASRAISMPSITSPQHPIPLNNSSQKIIIVSGMNQALPGSTTSASSKHVQQTLPPSNSVQLPVMSPCHSGAQIITFTNGQAINSHNGILLQNGSGSGAISIPTMPSTGNNILQASNHAMMNSISQQPLVIKVPVQSVNSGGQVLQPKLVLNEMNLLNSIPQSARLEPRHLHQQNVQQVFTIDNSQPQFTFTSSDGDTTQNIVYTFANGSVGASSDNIVLMHPDSVYFSKDATEIKQEQNDSFEDIISEETDENNPQEQLISETSVFGGSNDMNKPDNTTESNAVLGSSESEQFLMIPHGDIRESSDFRSDQHENSSSFNNIEALNGNNCIVEESTEGGLEFDMETVDDQEETLQIPTSSIYQAEDGTIFIQNADGTTLQVQGTDGQPVSLETVQAALGMDFDTQIITTQ
ncbi:uncharacterized protein LOC127873747 [Dreissena polymorpha]|uniref:C2H2-type domain-containing protein n=1 Tax=Dreissena polymorpha TaxID=45954 RepID=A0A9D4KXU3_DREPO|nr:uncharacterized protein LOC127873747 [Dreissena polymorpha]KAH3847926.1 hypothetical protein DPMN_090262 [Dreissena polymorpha]